MYYCMSSGAVLEQQMAAEEAEAAATVAPANASQPHVPQSAITRPALLQLDGHEGSIHRCATLFIGLILALLNLLWHVSINIRL